MALLVQTLRKGNGIVTTVPPTTQEIADWCAGAGILPDFAVSSGDGISELTAYVAAFALNDGQRVYIPMPASADPTRNSSIAQMLNGLTSVHQVNIAKFHAKTTPGQTQINATEALADPGDLRRINDRSNWRLGS